MHITLHQMAHSLDLPPRPSYLAAPQGIAFPSYHTRKFFAKICKNNALSHVICVFLGILVFRQLVASQECANSLLYLGQLGPGYVDVAHYHVALEEPSEE